MNFKKITYILIGLWICCLHSLKAQELSELLTKCVTDCETVAVNSQSLITTLDFHQEWDSIALILDFWEDACGINESTSRVRLLHLISTNRSINTHLNDYLEYDVYKYYRRNPYWHGGVGLSNRYYNYTKIHGDFDKWTKNIAQIELLKQEEKTDEYLMCLLFTNEFDKYKKLVKSTGYKNTTVIQNFNAKRLEHKKKYGGFVLYTGAWMPIGKLKEKFNIGAQFGFGVQYPIFEHFVVEARGIVTLWQNKKDLEFNIGASLHTLNNYNGVDISYLIGKRKQVFENSFLTVKAGIGGAIISTPEKDPDRKNNNNNNQSNNFVISTVQLIAGADFKTLVFNYHYIGLESTLSFSPYNLDHDLITETGAFALNFKLFYCF